MGERWMVKSGFFFKWENMIGGSQVENEKEREMGDGEEGEVKAEIYIKGNICIKGEKALKRLVQTDASIPQNFLLII